MMKSNRLKEEFYLQPATEAAPLLLGKLLCRNIDGRILKYRITETEAYYGTSDTACHAHKGRTNRTEIMFGNGGFAYIYLCYGIHYLLNVVTGNVDSPEAVLIRGVEGYNGPGKLTKALQIDKNLACENFVLSNRLWIEDDGYKPKYKTTPRIGINYASEKYRDILWRFVVE